MKDFFGKLIGFSVGPMVGALIGFITVPITSNLISPDQFGLASMFNLANTILTLCVLIGIDQAYMREYNEYKDKPKLLFNCMIIPFLNTIIVSILLIVFKEFWANILFDNTELTEPIIMLAIVSPLFIIEKFMLLSIRMQEKAFSYSLWNIVSKGLNLICLILLLLLYKRNFESVVYATIISQAIISIIIFIIYRKNIRLSFKSLDKQQIIRVLKFGLPIVPATLIGYGLNSMDTIYLRAITDYNELGYYSVALRIVTVLVMIQTSFTTFWAPMAFKWKNQNVDSRKFETVSKGIAFTMSIVLITILIFKDLIPIIISKEYMPVIYILPFLLLYPIFYTMSETTTLGISFSRKTGYNIIVSLIALLVNLILNTILVPKYMAVGAAIATGISYLVFFWIRTIISRRLWYNFPIKHFINTSGVLILVTLSNVIIKDILLVEIVDVLCLILIILNYRSIFKDVINLKKKKDMYYIGLICYDTQRMQIKNMLKRNNIEIIDINYQGNNKFKKLYFALTRISYVDILYFGYGCTRLEPYLKIAKLFKKIVICHWIGSDVLNAKKINNLEKVKKYINYNFACSKLIKEELQLLGIEAKEIPILPNNMEEDFSQLPKEHGVITYLPEGREKFYGIEYIKYAAIKYPDLMFYVVGNEHDILKLKNVKFLGKVSQENMSKLYDSTTILMRLPEHDGLSLMLLEALIKGKQVMYCYEFPFTIHIQKKEDIDIAMEKILNMPPSFNEEGHNYVLEKYNIDKNKEKLYTTIKEILKQN